ncbi:MAG TPA: glycosidase, partial [Candidatus Bathyarchaeia archaeon]|nr:glycosidase [Candidatus Bathyarchaeia archaeon]
MRRFQDNPILRPIVSNPWESRRVFNAAAVRVGKQVHILYRAIGNDGISRIGYAASSDGYVIDERSPIPIFEPNSKAEDCGCEDPRLTLFDNRIIMAYTALTEIDHEQLYQISLTSISVDDFLSKQWRWNERLLPFRGVRNKDAVIFPKKIDDKY